MKFVKSAVLAIGLLLMAHGSVSAQSSPASAPAGTTVTPRAIPVADFRTVGAGLVIIGAGLGIGGLTRSAVESMARQPEMAGNVQTAMIISAALIEGVSFFALIIILLNVQAY
jgi:F-type H+-transporting ATPase subunit c